MARRFTRRTHAARILLDGELVNRIDALEIELATAMVEDQRENRPPNAPVVAARLQVAEAERDASEIELEFVGLGRGRWELLKTEHPVPEDLAGLVEWNPDTFPPAAVRACCTNLEAQFDPELLADLGLESIDEVPDWLANELDVAQWSTVWRTVLAANLGGDDARPKSLLASGVTRASQAFSDTSEATASPSIDSSASGLNLP